MKQFRTLLLAVILTLGFTTLTNAQSKVAHISTDELISIMPETKVLNSELEKLKKTYDADLKAAEEKLKAKLKKYDGEAASQTQDENQRRMQEVQQEQQKLYEDAQKANDEILKKRNLLLEPIIAKAKKAIEEVAAENNFEYVIDKASLLIANGKDLLPLVKAKLGVQ